MCSAAVLYVSSILGLVVCLSLLGGSGTMVSNGWGVLPRFSRVKPVLLGFESDQTSLLTFVLESEHRQNDRRKEENQRLKSMPMLGLVYLTVSMTRRWGIVTRQSSVATFEHVIDRGGLEVRQPGVPNTKVVARRMVWRICL